MHLYAPTESHGIKHVHCTLEFKYSFYSFYLADLLYKKTIKIDGFPSQIEIADTSNPSVNYLLTFFLFVFSLLGSTL